MVDAIVKLEGFFARYSKAAERLSVKALKYIVGSISLIQIWEKFHLSWLGSHVLVPPTTSEGEL